MLQMCASAVGHERSSIRYAVMALEKRGIIRRQDGRPFRWLLVLPPAVVEVPRLATPARDGRICSMLARTSTPCGARTVAHELGLPPEQTADDLRRLSDNGHIIARPYTGGVLYGADRVLLDREKQSRARR